MCVFNKKPVNPFLWANAKTFGNYDCLWDFMGSLLLVLWLMGTLVTVVDCINCFSKNLFFSFHQSFRLNIILRSKIGYGKRKNKKFSKRVEWEIPTPYFGKNQNRDF